MHADSLAKWVQRCAPANKKGAKSKQKGGGKYLCICPVSTL